MSYINLSNEGGVQYVSVLIDPERVVNLVRLMFKDNARFKNGFVTRPGYSLFSAAVNSSIRGLSTTTDDQQGYIVDGDKFYTCDTSGTRTERGTLSTSTGYVDIIIGVDNVFINPTETSDGYVYIPSTTSFATITDPDFPDLLKATYQTTFFVGIERNTGRFWHSANDDASSWSATAFATAEYKPDNLVSIVSFDRNLYLFGEQSIEFWFTSNETFPFNLNDSTDIGCAATDSVWWLGDYVYFLAQSQHGVGQIYRINNQFIPQKISTQIIDTRLESFSDISDCKTIGFTHDGNEIVIFSFPTANITMVYNATTNSWSEWKDGAGNYYPFGLYMRLGNKHVIGSLTGGNLYQTNFTTSDDAGTDYSWQLITPTIYAEGRYITPDRLKLDCDDVVADGSDVLLKTSLDGGNIFDSGRTRTVSTGFALEWNMPSSSSYITYDISGTSSTVHRLFNLSAEIAIGGYR